MSINKMTTNAIEFYFYYFVKVHQMCRFSSNIWQFVGNNGDSWFCFLLVLNYYEKQVSTKICKVFFQHINNTCILSILIFLSVFIDLDSMALFLRYWYLINLTNTYFAPTSKTQQLSWSPFGIVSIRNSTLMEFRSVWFPNPNILPKLNW